jgi:hypothetical protein
MGPLFFGTPLQGYNSSLFVYDTGSGYMGVGSVYCVNCTAAQKYYNQFASSTSSNSTQYNTTTLGYGSG